MRNFTRNCILGLCLLGSIIVADPASAAIFLCDAADQIRGNATAPGYEDCIEVFSYQDGVGRGISAPVGGSSDREASQPSFSEITLTKFMDRASVLLRKEAAVGSSREWRIHFLGGGETPCEYFKVILPDALLSAHSMSSGGDLPSESMSLNFTKVEYYFYEGDGKSCGANEIVWRYDLAKAQPY